MDRIEMVEKLREKTGLSYEAATEALEKANWDILDALIALEKDGKVKGGAHFTTKDVENGKDSGAKRDDKPEGESFSELMNRLWNWIKDVARKSWQNQLCLYTKDHNQALAIPVIVFIVLLCFAFWVVLPLMIVSLFFGCRYAFRGPDLGKDSVNNAMGKATDVADSIKTEIKENIHKDNVSND